MGHTYNNVFGEHSRRVGFKSCALGVVAEPPNLALSNDTKSSFGVHARSHRSGRDVRGGS